MVAYSPDTTTSSGRRNISSDGRACDFANSRNCSIASLKDGPEPRREERWSSEDSEATVRLRCNCELADPAVALLLSNSFDDGEQRELPRDRGRTAPGVLEATEGNWSIG